MRDGLVMTNLRFRGLISYFGASRFGVFEVGVSFSFGAVDIGSIEEATPQRSQAAMNRGPLAN